MARDLTSGMVAAATAQQVAPIFIGFLDFDSGPVRVWTGVDDLSWDSETWTGAGDLLGLEPAEETTALVAAGAVLSMSGIPSELLSIALQEDYQERPATVWLAALDQSTSPPTLIADPYELLGARMDTMDISEGGAFCTIAMGVENRLIDGETARQGRLTSEDQKRRFPGDTGCDFVIGLQDREIVWGGGG